MPQTIILDTNFLMIPCQFGVDIFSEVDRICDFEYELAVLDKTVGELNKIISEQRGNKISAARMALELLKRKDLKIIRTPFPKPADDLLVEEAEKGAIVATQDSALKKRIKGKKGRIIFLRNKKFLQLD